MLEELELLLEAPLGVWEAVIRVGISVIAAVVAYFMYQLFYGSRHIGAGVNRTFLIGGPAITMIFLIIQTSIPLGLGLLGALSFVRFRTPIKDPAEIGFLLLLIASSISAATGNLIAIVILFAVVFIVLAVQKYFKNGFATFGRGHLMISVDRSSFSTLEKELDSFLGGKLRGLSLDTMSTIDDRISLHYQYQKQKNFDWVVFTNELNRIAGPTKVEVFIS